MLPLQLLRIRITKKGKNIAPLFCTSVDEKFAEQLQLAAKIIEEFEESSKKKDRNGSLAERISLMESQYDSYKLVRGFYTLLERRCVFRSKRSFTTRINNIGNNINNDAGSNNIATVNTTYIDPFTIRKDLFEESSKRGFALTNYERAEIMNTVASRLCASADNIADDMWSDLEENMILEQFYKISPEQLIAWYNLSLMQTLLFNCTKLEFYVHGGSNWKRILRDVKRLGLMYNLQMQTLERKEEPKQVHQQMKETTDVKAYGDSMKNNTIIVCSIDGPLSIFKLTDRYGTSIAKLLPSIISAETWYIKAWIVRKTMSSGKKIYEFEISNVESPTLLKEPYRDTEKNDNKDNKEKNEFPTYDATAIHFDSNIEEKFASRFEQSANGWKLVREPDPLIVSNGKALIPDFMFEKHGRKIYLEIVGFWTKEYLERKIQKITDVMTVSYNKIDFLIAVNNDYYATPNSYNDKEKITSSKLSGFIDKNHLILYRKDNVPLKYILDYLKSIDHEMIEKFASNNYMDLLRDLEHIIVDSSNNGIVSINEIAKKYNIPVESALRIIKSEEESQKEKKNDDDDNDSKYIIVDRYLILKSKVKELELLLGNVVKFDDVQLLLAKNGIPESCHITLISKLGFDIIWKGIDCSNATIERRKK
jgi:predicted nuclease of restriction endonuclease-like RecB superfamily